MSKYSNLLQNIKLRVCENNKISITSLNIKNNYKVNQVWYRIGQIYTLECILEEYRKHLSSTFNGLQNEKALHHLIFDMTKWKLDYIRSLSLNDCLFVIASQLKTNYMSEEAATFLTSLNLPSGPYPFDEFPSEDWNPAENSVILYQ
jgi:hypothetical protein